MGGTGHRMRGRHRPPQTSRRAHRLQADQPQTPRRAGAVAGALGHRVRTRRCHSAGDRRARDDSRAAPRRGTRPRSPAGAPGRGDTRRQARLPGTALAGPHRDQGRPVLHRGRGGLGDREGPPGHDDGRTGRGIRRVRRFRLRGQRRIPVARTQGRAGGAGADAPPPAFVVLPRRAAQVAAPQEGPLLRRGGRTGKRGQLGFDF